jgi:isocitrate dehydrogenase
VAATLAENEEKIVSELNSVQGHKVEIGGYYRPDDALVTAVMRPSATLNGIIDALA